MIDLTGITHHPAIEEMVDLLCHKTRSSHRSIFRTEMAYFLSKMASAQRATIVTKDRGEIPVNVYAVILALSGFGKGFSVGTIEELMAGFQKRFMEETLPVIAEQSMWVLANERAIRNGSDPQDEFDKLSTQYRCAGAYIFEFDEGTCPAVKQFRHKLQIARCGSINLQIDEIGSNLIKSTDILNLYLELYDQGRTKDKLTKNTNDNQRAEEVGGKTPCNMLLFGTPAKLLDGGPVEKEFTAFLDTGYARRCIFGWGEPSRKKDNSKSPAEIYKHLIDPGHTQTMQKWSNHFHRLADPGMFGWKMEVEDDVAIQLITYQMACENAAEDLSEHEEIRKAELKHRYFKALKLAGALAFCDASNQIEMGHLMQAILLVEESGDAFNKILTREKANIRLAKYIASTDAELTESELQEVFPFYRGTATSRKDLMTLAISWGYKNNVIIKRSFKDGIEFFSGETIVPTDLEKLVISGSTHFAYGYKPAEIAWDTLGDIVQSMQDDGSPFQWANHHFQKEHRADENVIPGFNMLILDIDGGISLKEVHNLLGDYKFMTYTTKRHTDLENRFRLILPINYFLKLDKDDYQALVNGVLATLPFEVDKASNQRSKSWATYAQGDLHVNDGQLFDILPFIPKTTRYEQRLKEDKAVKNLDSFERWFAARMGNGNRNSQMIKYALALVDTGMDLVSVTDQVISFDSKLGDPMGEDELRRSILVTVAKRIQKRAA
jgi:hypothetical protein